MSCWCGAGYESEDDCPRCSGIELFALPDLDLELPPLDLSLPRFPLPDDPPDGPDEMLCAIAEMEAIVERERALLEATGGARRCRFCEGIIPPGPAAGVHDECLPEELPDGARSCAGCAELILDEDDEFEHDFCLTPADTFDPDELPLIPLDEDDDEPTVPTPHTFEDPAALREYRDEVLCTCSRWLPVVMAPPLKALERNMLTSTTVTCACGTAITVSYSWVRGCVVGLHTERSRQALN